MGWRRLKWAGLVSFIIHLFSIIYASIPYHSHRPTTISYRPANNDRRYFFGNYPLEMVASHDLQ
jgi:hypothetical protein